MVSHDELQYTRSSSHSRTHTHAHADIHTHRVDFTLCGHKIITHSAFYKWIFCYNIWKERLLVDDLLLILIAADDSKLYIQNTMTLP